MSTTSSENCATFLFLPTESTEALVAIHSGDSQDFWCLWFAPREIFSIVDTRVSSFFRPIFVMFVRLICLTVDLLTMISWRVIV